MKSLKSVAWILLVVGGLNWGLVGLFDFNLVATLPDGAARIVYILVGVSALVAITGMKKCRSCNVEHRASKDESDQ